MKPISDTLKGKISQVEWKARIELAALYRLVAHFAWDDLIFTHISARVAAKDSLIRNGDDYVASDEDHFLINPYGLFFDEITASSLVKVDQNAKIVQDEQALINPAGFTIHSAVHGALHKACYVIHLHTDAMTAVSIQEEGLLPLTQNALLLRPQIAYHDYEGVALDHEERARIVADMGDKRFLILRNHGSLTWGESAGEAIVAMHFLERACRQQLLALSGGRQMVREVPLLVQDKVAQLSGSIGFVAGLAWPGLLRKLDRHLPGYDL